MWKEKLEILKAKREAKGEKMELPNDEEMIENAASHIPEMKECLSENKNED